MNISVLYICSIIRKQICVYKYIIVVSQFKLVAMKDIRHWLEKRKALFEDGCAVQ